MRVFAQKLSERHMKQKRYTPEQIITILREVDKGKGIQEVCRANNISPQSYPTVGGQTAKG